MIRGNFYPSITEKTLDEALKLAKEYILISEEKINIIKHCHKSLLYHYKGLWFKKGDSGNFDKPIDSFDGTELCELVGCLLLYKLDTISDPSNHGRYRDDVLIIVDGCTPRKGDNIKKTLH